MCQPSRRRSRELRDARGTWRRRAPRGRPRKLAPPLLALPVFAARRGLQLSRKLVIPSIVLGLVMVLAVHAWILDPSLLRFAPASYDAKLDIANELFGWPRATRHASELLEEANAASGRRL